MPFETIKQLRRALEPWQISNLSMSERLVDRWNDLVSPELDLTQHRLLVEIPQLGLNCDLVRFKDIHLFQ